MARKRSSAKCSRSKLLIKSTTRSSRSGRDPGLLESRRRRFVAFKVFPIESKENKRVEVR